MCPRMGCHMCEVSFRRFISRLLNVLFCVDEIYYACRVEIGFSQECCPMFEVREVVYMWLEVVLMDKIFIFNYSPFPCTNWGNSHIREKTNEFYIG